MKAIVIGRHSGEIPGIEVIENRAVRFPETSAECAIVFESLRNEAKSRGAALLFQAVPGQLAVAINKVLVKEARRHAVACVYNLDLGHLGYNDEGNDEDMDVMVGVIVSKAGERPAGVRVTVPCVDGSGMFSNLDQVVNLAKTINPNTKIDTDVVGFATVTVDPPMKFQFSHIEWF